MKNISRILVPILAALLLATATPALAQSVQCLNQAQIQQAIGSGQILALPTIYAQNNLQPNQVVGAVQVCNRNGQWYYVLQVLKGSRADPVWISAQTGQ